MNSKLCIRKYFANLFDNQFLNTGKNDAHAIVRLGMLSIVRISYVVNCPTQFLAMLSIVRLIMLSIV